jgi:predicted heme/steroid binding protein
MEEASSSVSGATPAIMDKESQSIFDEAMIFLGLASKASPKDAVEDDDTNNTGDEGKGRTPAVAVVKVALEPEVIDSLPIIPLSIIRNPSTSSEYAGRLLVTYDGIVYDVTEFTCHHPGGKDLLLTSVGLDLSHFFTNYTIHSTSHAKVAAWLSSMAVGKLTPQESVKLFAPMKRWHVPSARCGCCCIAGDD